jgi:hypothetical protein
MYAWQEHAVVEANREGRRGTLRFLAVPQAKQRSDAQRLPLFRQASPRESTGVLRDEGQRAGKLVARVRGMRALKKLEPCCGQRRGVRGATGPSRLDSHDRFGLVRRRDRWDGRLRVSSGRLEGWAPRLLESRRGPLRSAVKREHRPDRPCGQHDQRRKRDPNGWSQPLQR